MSALRTWLFEPVPRTWAVLCRVAFGSIFFFAWVFYLPHVQDLFGPEGIGGASTIARVPEAGGLFRESSIEWLRGVERPEVVWAAYAILLGSALAFAVGWWTRTSGVLLLFLHASFVDRMPFAFWGWAAMIPPFTAYVILANPGRELSIDAWRAARKREASDWRGIGSSEAWPKRLLQVHVCTMYAVTGWARMDQPGWLEGSMLYDALTNLMFARADVDWNPWIPLLRLPSYAVYLLEPAAPVLLWLPSVGPWIAMALIAMHAGIEITATVGWWNFMMSAALLTFLPERWTRRLLPRSRRAGEPPSVAGRRENATG